ncbi:MAG: hypothetical protein AAGK04_10220 [Planctomycetota bacterium]
MQRMKSASWMTGAGVLTLSAGLAVAQTATGFTVESYADVIEPRRLSFDAATGDLYVGHGSNSAREISVVSGADQSVATFGGLLSDADAVYFDSDGMLTGLAGQVLVGSGTGLFAAANGSSTPLVLPATGGFSNPTEFVSDGAGTVYFTDYQGMAVLSLNGGSVSPVVTGLAPTVEGLAIGPGGTLYTSDRSGTLRSHSGPGDTQDIWTSAGAEYRWMTESDGSGSIGEGLIVWDQTSSELLLFEDYEFSMAPTVLGTSFGGVKGLEFGPDGYLYISNSADQILRLVPIPAPGALAGLGVGLLALGRRRD